MTTADVVIVGGGPVGLMLACELRLAGARPIVLERLDAPTGLSKALGIQGRGVDLLELRGLLPRFGDAPTSASGLVHFGGIPLDVSRLAGRPPRYLFVQQARIEQVLEARALEMGVDLRRGHELRSLVRDDTGVTLEAHTDAGPVTLRSRYAVGCDGGHSTVRALAGIGFPGLDATMLLRLGDVMLDGDVTVGPRGVLIDGRPAPFGFGVPLGDGYFRVVTREPLPEGFDRSAPMTLDELRQSVARVHGPTPAMREARWLSRFTDASRQAECYRAGRVFLAGDAAHIHLPAGGPGLSTGLADAVNLGWKLAAALHGRAPAGLLDSYHAERHLAGERVLLHTRAQGALLASTPAVAALKTLLGEIFREEHTLRLLVDLLQGADVRYDMGPAPASRTVGSWVPATTVRTVDGPRALGDLLRPPRGLLLHAIETPPASVPREADVDVVRVLDAPSRLVRPDGFVAWEGPGPGLDAAVARWFAR